MITFDEDRYEYDEAGKLILRTNWYGKGEEKQPYYKIAYTYNDNGQLLRITDILWYTDKWEDFTESSYFYNENNKLIRRVYKFPNGEIHDDNYYEKSGYCYSLLGLTGTLLDTFDYVLPGCSQ